MNLVLPYPPSANRYLSLYRKVWYNRDRKNNVTPAVMQHPGVWIPSWRLDTMLDFTTVLMRHKNGDQMTCVPESHGIYIISNSLNNHFYIGSTVNLRRRWHQHRWYLTRNRHHNPHLQNAWNKYGAESFEFLVMEIVAAHSDILPREQAWIDLSSAASRTDCYNFCAKAGSHLGRKRSDETRRRLSEAQKGKKATEDAKQKMRAAKIGKKQSPEHKAKVMKSRVGKKINRPTGIINPNLRRFSPEQVRDIRQKKKSGFSYSQLCEEYKSCLGPIQRIVARESYKDIA